jgi:hypothetical protein
MKSILILASLFLSAASFAASSCTPATGHFGYNSATVVGNKVSVSVPMLYLENGEKAALILNQGLTTVQNGTAICLALGFKHGSVNDMTDSSMEGWPKLASLNDDGTLAAVYSGRAGFLLASELICEK